MSLTTGNGQIHTVVTDNPDQELPPPSPERIRRLLEAACYFANAAKAAEEATRVVEKANQRVQIMEVEAHSAHNDAFEQHLNGYDGEYRPMGFTAEHPPSGSPQTGPVGLAAERAKLDYERASVDAKRAEICAEQSGQIAQATHDGLVVAARSLFAGEPEHEEPPVRLATSTQPTGPPTDPPQHWDLAEAQEASRG